MNVIFLYGCLAIIGIFSSITGYVIGYIRGTINSNGKLKLFFRGGYKSALKEFIGPDIEVPEVYVEEALLEWQNIKPDAETFIQ